MTRILPLCTPDELEEEIADIDHDLERLADARSVSTDSAERGQERRATLLHWRARLVEQLAADTRCDACGDAYANKWAHAEECAGAAA